MSEQEVKNEESIGAVAQFTVRDLQVYTSRQSSHQVTMCIWMFIVRETIARDIFAADETCRSTEFVPTKFRVPRLKLASHMQIVRTVRDGR